MQMLGHNTELFKNIFPTYEDFESWYLATPLSDSGTDVPNKKTFTLIAYEFNDSRVCMSVESFKEHFAIDVYTFYKEFEETTKGIIELMALTDSEISTADSLITNIANVPETSNSTNLETLDYISQHQKMINKKGALQIKREQLTSKRAFTVRTFLNRFRHLFVRILSPSYNFVVKEKNTEE